MAAHVSSPVVELSPRHIPDVVLSQFTSYNSKKPFDTTLVDIFFIIRTDIRLQMKTDKYRKAISVGDTSSNAKHTCPAFTPAVHCVGGRQRTHIDRYTGMSLVDIDDLEPEDYKRLFPIVAADPHTIGCHKTISGRGMRILFGGVTEKGDFSHLPVSEAEKLYEPLFMMGNNYYATLLGVSPDLICKNPERISGMAYDPDAYLASDYLPFGVATAPAPKPSGEPCRRGERKGRPRRSYTVEEVARVAVKQVERQGCRYVEGERNNFISRVLYRLNRYGIAESEAETWAKGEWGDYPDGELQSIVRSVYSHVEEHATYYFRPSRAGISQRRGARYAGDDSGAKRPKISDMAQMLAGYFEGRINLYTSQCELRILPDCEEGEALREEMALSDRWEQVTDRTLAAIRLAMSRRGMEMTASDVHQILMSPFSSHYNPLQEFIDSLPRWEDRGEESDHILCLSRRIEVKGDRGYFDSAFRKWFVGMVRSGLERDYVNQCIFTFIGRQGCYKTSFFSHLLPPELRRYFYTRSNGDGNPKDEQLTLSEFLLIDIEEIDQMSRAEVNRLKSMTSKPAINERPAYGRCKEHRPHLASFCATGNNHAFLTDLTGNRRWLVFEVTQILSPFDNPIDYAGLYAQAAAMVERKMACWFDDEEIRIINRHNSEFEAPSREEELILSYFRTYAKYPGEEPLFLKASEVAAEIELRTRTRLHVGLVTQAMRRLGIERVRYGEQRGYKLFMRSMDEIEEMRKNHGALARGT